MVVFFRILLLLDFAVLISHNKSRSGIDKFGLTVRPVSYDVYSNIVPEVQHKITDRREKVKASRKRRKNVATSFVLHSRNGRTRKQKARGAFVSLVFPNYCVLCAVIVCLDRIVSVCLPRI